MFEDCGQQVKTRRPNFLRTVSKYDDGTGQSMAWHWLTRQERKRVRDNRKKKALEVAQEQVYGSTALANSFKSNIHQRAHNLFDKMTAARVNVARDSRESLSGYSPELRVIIGELKMGATTLAELAEAIVMTCEYTEINARREAEALVSILKACGRVRKCGHEMELV